MFYRKRTERILNCRSDTTNPMVVGHHQVCYFVPLVTFAVVGSAASVQ